LVYPLAQPHAPLVQTAPVPHVVPSISFVKPQTPPVQVAI
jgi:hypothetical protein